MQQHVRLLRSHALGSFSDLLQAICRDPAMLTWLGADANRKAAPNEGFVRPLLETFTLGPGAFTDADVRDAARAFTGWFVLRGQLRYIAREHDETVKHVLGREGNFAAEDVVRIVLEQPATARLLVRKLYRWLISETDEPADAMIEPLAEVLRQRLQHIRGWWRRCCDPTCSFHRLRIAGGSSVRWNSPWESPRPWRGWCLRRVWPRISPISVRICAIHPRSKAGPAGAIGSTPPRSQAVTILRRALLQGGEPYGDKLNPSAVARKHGYATSESAARFLLDLFLQGDIEPDIREALLKSASTPATSEGDGLKVALRDFAHAVITLPEFHLA